MNLKLIKLDADRYLVVSSSPLAHITGNAMEARVALMDLGVHIHEIEIAFDWLSEQNNVADFGVNKMVTSAWHEQSLTTISA